VSNARVTPLPPPPILAIKGIHKILIWFYANFHGCPTLGRQIYVCQKSERRPTIMVLHGSMIRGSSLRTEWTTMMMVSGYSC
jgi:hypothetical protein